jgi:hypothetical protein
MPRENEEIQRRRSGDSIGWKSPIGWIEVTGKTAVVVAMLAALGYIAWRHDERSAEQNSATVEAIREMAFVLTLTENERKALQLTMPVSMRDRLLKQQRELRGAEYRRNDQ